MNHAPIKSDSNHLFGAAQAHHEDSLKVETLFSLFQGFRRYAKWILALGAIAFVTRLLWLLTLPASFESESAVALVKSSTSVNFDSKIKNEIVDQNNFLEKQNTWIAIARSSEIADSVREQLGSVLEPAERNAQALLQSARIFIDGDLIKIKINASSSKKAALIANSWAEICARRLNKLYGESADLLTQTQTQAASSKKKYLEAESQLIEFFKDNPKEALSHQISERQKILAIALDAAQTVFQKEIEAKKRRLEEAHLSLSQIDRLLSDAKALEKGWKSTDSKPEEISNGFANLLLEMRALGPNLNSSAAVQLQMNTESAPKSRAQLLKDLQGLMITLGDQKKEIQENISSLAKDLLESPNLPSLANNSATQKGVANASFSTNPSMEKIYRQINELQAQLEASTAKQQELTRTRDLTWTSYSQLMNRVAETELSSTNPSSIARLALAAVEPTSAIEKKPWTQASLAGVIALLASSIVFLSLHFVRSTIGSQSELSLMTGISPLATIPYTAPPKRIAGEKTPEKLLVADKPFSHGGKAYTYLQYNLQFSLREGHKSLLIASSLPNEGKSVVAANLATALAFAGRSVILVDANLWHPSQHTFFEAPNTVGLANLLFQKNWENVKKYLRETSTPGLKLLSSGTLPANPPHMLDFFQMAKLIRELELLADIIVIDGPAASASPETMVLARSVDATVLVVESGRATTSIIRSTLEKLESAGANIAGIVLNKANSNAASVPFGEELTTTVSQ